MKKNDVDGREAAQARQCIQPCWLASLHWTVRRLRLAFASLQHVLPHGSLLFQHHLDADTLYGSESCIYAVTSDPTFSPSTTRRMFPGWFMLKMIIGRLLSLHRLTAVRSITFSPWRRISM